MIKKLTILYHYFVTRYRMRFSPPALQRWHDRRFKKIARFTKKHSLFYRTHWGQVISKKLMMDHFSTFNTRKIDKEEAFRLAWTAEQTRDFHGLLNGVTVGLSSGTSGNRGLFLVSEAERLFWCGNILAKILPEAPWHRQKVALFLRANSTLYETVGSNKLTFAYFDLLEDLITLREKIKDFAPDVLAAPPSMLLLLMGSCRPKRVISIAETLFASDEKRLEEGFQQKIFQIYQCTEGFLGFTCSHGTMHLNEDILIIEKEYLDDHHFVPIITDLFRKAQPIIRYRLDDVLVEKKTKCPCGCAFQALERIEGRCDDLLYVAVMNGHTKPLFPDFVSRKIIAASEDIEEYEVVQTGIDCWEIYLKPPMNDPVADALHELFDRIGAIPPKLIFVREPFSLYPGAKRRRIRREYGLAGDEHPLGAPVRI